VDCGGGDCLAVAGNAKESVGRTFSR
jgi:hypothetical protein